MVGVKLVAEVAVERAAAVRDLFNFRVVLVEIPCGESIVKLLFWPSECTGVEGLNAGEAGRIGSTFCSCLSTCQFSSAE